MFDVKPSTAGSQCTIVIRWMTQLKIYEGDFRFVVKCANEIELFVIGQMTSEESDEVAN